MSTPMQATVVALICIAVYGVIVMAIVHDAMYGKRPRTPKTRFHWNDERQIAKLRHPSAQPSVYECWDPRCDCHNGKSLPYDWRYDDDLT